MPTIPVNSNTTKETQHFFKSRRFIDILVGIFSIIFGIHFLYISNGDVINSYPLITQDGFDWYTEGLYLVRLLSGHSNLPTLPILRPPVFVGITALDYLFGGSGIVLSIIFSATIFGTYYFIARIIDFQYENTDNKWYLIPAALATTIYPINYIKVYLLSDPFCVFITLAASFFFIKYFRNNKSINLLLSSVLFLLAGMTQAYGLIPFLILYGLGILTLKTQNKKKSAAIIISGIFIVVLFVLSTYAWRRLMPHNDIPTNIGYLKLSLEMFGFYVGVWGYYLVPFLLYFLISRNIYVRKISLDNLVSTNNLVSIGCLLIVITFLVFCFLYQWQEARFTYYLWAWLLITVFTNVRLKENNSKPAIWISVIIVLTCLVTPSDYWIPSSASLKIEPTRYWLLKYFESQSQDRELKLCTPNCENNKFLSQSDGYVNAVITVYNQIK